MNREKLQSGNAYCNNKYDEQAARDAFEASDSLYKKMIENAVDAQLHAHSVPAPQLREELQRAWGALDTA